MLGSMGKYGCYVPADHLMVLAETVHLPSSHAEKLNNSPTDAFGYNKCRFGSTLEADLMVKSINGEKTA